MNRTALLFVAMISLSIAQAEDTHAPWSDNLTTELKSAAGDSKLLLVLIRHVQDAGSLDAGEWLRHRELKPLLENFHPVAIWSGNAALKEFKFAPPSGLLFLTPKGEPVAIEDVPMLRADLKPLLERVLASPQPMDEASRPAVDEKGRPNAAMQRRQLRGLPEEMRTQLRELLQAARAQNDARASARGKELVDGLLARTMSRDECLRSAGILQMAIAELDLSGAGEKLAAKIQQEAPVGRVAADAFLDLAELAFTQGRRNDAMRLVKDAEKASENGESPTFYRTALAMRALWDGKHGPNHSKWAKREVRDVAVLVSDMRSYAKAIARWDEKTFFPVLFQDDIYAPKFIAAFKPAQVILVPKDPIGDIDATEVVHADEDFRERLNRWGGLTGVVFTDGTSGETAGALALAAGRFQALEFLFSPKIGDKTATVDQHLSKNAAWDFTKEINARMAKWGLPKKEEGWSYITLAGAYPFRYSGDTDGYGFGATYALDDLIGRDENTTRHSVVGRLIGDNARSAYQAMCSLFLQPENVFLFNTYGLNPKSIWGAYRMDFSESAFKDRFALTHMKGDGANIQTFREHVFPWNRDNLITINSSGGHMDWSVGGGGGTADDFPVGAPCAIHVTHSGSAGDPYNPDTLAGRAIWGGAFFYFGSTAEPFLTSFQPPSVHAPLIANGAPLAAAFRKRTGNYFGWPWRLMIVGDPQFALRNEPVKRIQLSAKNPLIANGELSFWSDRPGVKPHVPGVSETLPPTMPFPTPMKLARMKDDFPAALNEAMRIVKTHSANNPDDPEDALDVLMTKNLIKPDPAEIVAALEVLIQARANDVALDLWKRSQAAVSKNYAARIYARQAAGALLDQALAAEDFAALQQWMDALLTTGPAGNFVERWLDKILAVAEKKKEEAGEWLASRMADERFAAYRGSFAKIALRKTFFKDWMLLGPFKDEQKLDPAKLDFTASFTDHGQKIEWKRPFNEAAFGSIDLNTLLNPHDNVHAYAAAVLIVENDIDGALLLGSDDGIVAWLDGKEIHRNPASRGLKPDEDVVSVKLSAGKHMLLLRIDQGGGGWGFCARMSSPGGKKPLGGVTWKCAK